MTNIPETGRPQLVGSARDVEAWVEGTRTEGGGGEKGEMKAGESVDIKLALRTGVEGIYQAR